jgi:hypothetical protein
MTPSVERELSEEVMSVTIEAIERPVVGESGLWKGS